MLVDTSGEAALSWVVRTKGRAEVEACLQISQEKIARMAGNIQAMWLMAWRLSRLHEQVQILSTYILFSYKAEF